MAHLYKDLQTSSGYVDRTFPGAKEEYTTLIEKSCTLYVGNLAFDTSEEQIFSLFRLCGEVRRLIMGIDRESRTPCGFCFVEYYLREHAEDAQKYLSGTMLDNRTIRVDWDYGFAEGRQYGRGKHGGQVRDEYRNEYDDARGGYGRKRQESMARNQDDELKGRQQGGYRR